MLLSYRLKTHSEFKVTNMGENRNWARLLLFVVTVICTGPLIDGSTKQDNCEYDIDLTKNFIKISCNGSASSVNVYADTAHVSGEDGGEVNSNVNDSGHDEGKGQYVEGRPSRSKPTKHGDKTKGGHSKASNSRRRSNKELRGRGVVDSESGRMSADQKWDFSKFDSVFSDVVWNATQKLDDAKRKLTNYAGSLRNISTQLAEGDLHLRSDMDSLRRTSNTATDLKEGIIVAMRNQYNFMRSALLTHNYELIRVMNSLDVLVDVTSDGFKSALMAHKTSLDQIAQLNSTMLAVRKMVTAELRKRHRRMWGFKKGNNTCKCPKDISAIGYGHSRKMKTQTGAYMVESFTPKLVTSVWVMEGSGKNDRLIEYDTAIDIDHGMPGRYTALPFFCRGTGHAIYRRHFYCHVDDSNTIIKYHIKKMDIVSEVYLPGTQSYKYPYKSGHNTDVDLAVDESGLWAIYATDESSGKMVISKINHQKMEVEKTWVTKYLKKEVGNAFMICGVLYATNSHSDTPTFIRYIYDTTTSTDRVLQAGQLPFPNSATLLSSTKKHRTQNLSNSVMLNYDCRASLLYSWSNSKVESFPVYFHK